VVEEGDGELADVEVPVGVASPFDVERFPVVELRGTVCEAARRRWRDCRCDGWERVFFRWASKATELAGDFDAASMGWRSAMSTMGMPRRSAVM